MLITKRSPVTGVDNTMDLDITHDQLLAWQRGELIQNAMPNLSADEREFMISGCTKADWNQLFGTHSSTG